MKYLFYAILIYLAWQLIFKLIIPVFLATRQFKKQVRDLHSRMNEQTQAAASSQSASQGPRTDAGTRVNPDDYLEFEEVK